MFISNSGSVNGPPSAYRLLRAYMERRYRYESTSRVIVTTDGHDDAYKVLAWSELEACPTASWALVNASTASCF